MARRSSKTTLEVTADPSLDVIIDTTVVDEMETSYLDYAMSVITARALPSVYDGLKPVQRRILYAMHEHGRTPEKSYVKSARTVGDVMGVYHPHGDASIYESLVNLVTAHSKRVPLIDGHGNFGSTDDPPAAARYCVVGDTRVRLADGTTLRIADLVALAPNTEADADFGALGQTGEVVHVSRAFNSGVHPVKRLITYDGFSIAGSHNHLVRCLTFDGDPPEFRWLRLDEITPGTVVCIARPAWPQTSPWRPDEEHAAIPHRRAPIDAVPEEIWAGTREDKLAFILSTLETATPAQPKDPEGSICYVTPSERLAAELQILLTEFSVIAARDVITVPRGGFLHRLTISGATNTKAFAFRPVPGRRDNAEIVDSKYHFAVAGWIVDEAPAPVYSLRVDTDEHAFLAGGFVNHNTEARLDPAALPLVAGLDEDTVDWIPNYDATVQEPTVLPAGFPNLLVNGASGIAVGMATNMVPHNLGEAIAGCKALLENPDITLAELMTHVPGPDFPTGGVIVGSEGIKGAYETGKGTITLRARTEIGDGPGKRRAIIVTELPYMIGVEAIVAKVREMVNAKRLVGVAAINDLTDRKSGLRLVIECKSGFDPGATLETLFQLTPLQITVAIHNVCLVDLQPRTLGLKDLISYYLTHRIDVVRRRTEYRRRKAEARAHLLEGLIRVVSAIDAVVAIIKGSKDTAEAKEKLMARIDLDEIQAQAALDMPLRRLTGLEVTKLGDELQHLREEITSLSELLSTEANLRAQVATELDQVADSLADPRRTTLTGAELLTAAPLTAPTETTPCLVVLSASGMLGRAAADYDVKRPAKADIARSVVSTTTASQIDAITSAGQFHRIAVDHLPLIEGKSRGGEVRDLVPLERGEELVAVTGVYDKAVLAIITKRGIVKRIKIEVIIGAKTGIEAIALAPGDAVVGVVELDADTADSTDLVAVTTAAQLLRLPASSIRPQGLSAGGMAGMRLGEEDEVLALGSVREAETDVWVATASDAGRAKITAAADYPAKGRGTGGVRCQTLRKGETKLAAAWIGRGRPLMATSTGATSLFNEEPARRDASGTDPAAGAIALFGQRPTAPAAPAA